MSITVHDPVRRILAALFILAFLAGWSTHADAHGDKKPDKKGILLVAFGTTVPGADSAYKNIEKKAKEAFPGVEVRMAYSSKIVRHKLAAEKKLKLDSPAEALAKMMNDDFTHVAVQSLQTIPGAEFHDIMATAKAFSGMPKGMKQVEVGLALMATTEDVAKVAEALLASVPKDRKAGEAVVLVGHGTHHPADVYYAALQYHVWKKDPLVFIGTVEGAPSQEDVLAELKKSGVKKAHLMPFLAVAGDHARNDLAGDEPDSWKSVMAGAGIAVTPVLRGTGDASPLADIWIEHLKSAFERLK